ncbi:MAG: 30S ribosome-binding factor RbfA [Alkalispirochaeta sp.]
MDDTRRARLAHRIQEELSTLLLKGEIKDHRVNTLISFSFVKLAKDGSVARIGVSSVLEDRVVNAAVEGLNSGAGYLQGRIGRTLKLRQTPRLYFVADHSIEEGQAIINTINELAQHEERDSSSQQTDGD